MRLIHFVNYLIWKITHRQANRILYSHNSATTKYSKINNHCEKCFRAIKEHLQIFAQFRSELVGCSPSRIWFINIWIIHPGTSRCLSG